MEKPYFYRFARPILSSFLRVCYRPRIEGREWIPKEGSVILAGNHTHNFDALLLISATNRTIHFLGKKELTDGPFGFLFRAMGVIRVDRARKNKKAMEEARYLLKKREVIGIFPEGTYPKNGEFLLPFKLGAVALSRDTNSCIVPFMITGTYRLFRKGLCIRFLKPIRAISDNLETENNRLRELIASELKEVKIP